MEGTRTITVVKTVTEWFRALEGWRREQCCACGGHEMVSHYG
jgi:hypothetical protein